jgi:hypothetical protein
MQRRPKSSSAVSQRDDDQMETRRQLRWEWSYLDASNDRLKAVIEKAPPDDQWAAATRDRFAKPFGTVEVHPQETYAVPKTVAEHAPHRVGKLQGLLNVLKELNDHFEGASARDCQILLNCDPVVLAIQADFMTWVGGYAQERLSHPVEADHSCPVRTFRRIYEEIGPRLNELACMTTSLHSLVLEQVYEYFVWLVAAGTWFGEFVRSKRREDGSVDVFTRFEDQERRDYVSAILQVQKWTFHDTLVKLAVDLDRASDGPDLRSKPPGDVLERLRQRAEDVAEMRPLLVRNFQPMKSAVRLAEGVWVAFSWSLGHRVGEVFAGRSEEHLLRQWSASRFQGILALRPDGLLAYEATPWITGQVFDTDDAPISVLAANLVALDAIHARLYSFWEQIDVDAVLRGLHPKVATGVLDGDEEAEFVGATVQKLVADDPEALVSGSVVRALRFSVLERCLARLRCEVRFGKGSEVVVYREGGRHFTLGHHKGNDRVPASLIRQLLRRVGVSLKEWATALGLSK